MSLKTNIDSGGCNLVVPSRNQADLRSPAATDASDASGSTHNPSHELTCKNKNS